MLAAFHTAHLRHRGIMHSRPHAVDRSPHVGIAAEVLVWFGCTLHPQPADLAFDRVSACRVLDAGLSQPRVKALQCYMKTTL